jgi:Uma2 family endonuclease
MSGIAVHPCWNLPPEKWDLPDHKQLPCEDGVPMNNFQEPDQGELLTAPLLPVLQHLRPEGDYCIGRDSGIYWRLTDPYLAGCKAPDWFLVLGVPATLAGEVRRSYVLWVEGIAPLIAIEFVSGDGSEERDRTPYTGKFWVYEQGIRMPYYAIYEFATGTVEVHRLTAGSYQRMSPNERGHFLIEPLGAELGIWNGVFRNVPLGWLRWYDVEGNLLPTGEDRAEQERQAREQAQQQAEQARRLAERLAERLRALGVDPDAV